MTIFCLFWVYVVFCLIYFGVFTRKNASRVLLYVTPHDDFRRSCNWENPPDAFGLDYSRVLTSVARIYGFCEVAKMIPDYGVAQDYDCVAMANGADSTGKNHLSQEFFRSLAFGAYANTTSYPYGFVGLKSTACVREEDVNEAGQPPLTAAYVCTRELSDILTALSDSGALDDGYTSLLAEQEYPEGSPFLDDYTAEAINVLSKKVKNPSGMFKQEYDFSFLMKFCVPLKPLTDKQAQEMRDQQLNESTPEGSGLEAASGMCAPHRMLLKDANLGNLVLVPPVPPSASTESAGQLELAGSPLRSATTEDGQLLYRLDYTFFPSKNNEFLHQLLPKKCVRSHSGTADEVIDKLGFSQYADYISNLFNNVIDGAITEIQQEWPFIAIGAFLILVLSVAVIFLLRYCVAVLTWITLVGVLICIGWGAITLILLGRSLDEENQMATNVFGYYDPMTADRAAFFQALGYIVAVIFVIGLIVIIIFGNAIQVAVQVIRTACMCLSDMVGLVFLPIMFFLGCALHLAWTICATVGYFVTGQYNSRYGSFTFDLYDGTKVVSSPWDWINFLILVYAVIWGTFFIYDVMEYVIGASVAQWYFTRPTLPEKGARSIGCCMCCNCCCSCCSCCVPPDDRTPTCDSSSGSCCCRRGKVRVLKHPAVTAMKFCFKSLGTVALASFIVSFVVWVRWLFNFIMNRVRASKEEVRENKVIKAISCYINCCLKCLEKLLKYINRNSLLVAGITGEGYFSSCGQAVALLVSHISSVLTVNALGDVILFVAKIFISLGSGIITGCLIRYAGGSEMFLVPSAIVFCCGLLISTYLMNLVELIIDAVFLCYMYEEKHYAKERAAGLPPYAPKALAQLLGR